MDLHQNLREKQLREVEALFPDASRQNPSSSIAIPFSLPNHFFYLNVDISNIPFSAPVLEIIPPSRHQLLSASSRVLPIAHKNLQQWSVNSSLGQTVRDILYIFKSNPPQIQQSTNQPQQNEPPPPYRFNNTANTTNSGNNAHTSFGSPHSSVGSADTVPGQYQQHQQHAHYQQNQQAQQNYHQQTANSPTANHFGSTSSSVPQKFPEIERLSTDQLQLLLSDEKAFEDVFQQLEYVKLLHQQAEQEMKASAVQLAQEQNHVDEKLKQLNEQKQQLYQKQSEISEQRRKYNELLAKKQAILQQFSIEVLLQKLDAAANAVEQQSDDLVKEFFNEEMDMKQFSKQYLAKRKLFHSRAAKKESVLLHYKK